MARADEILARMRDRLQLAVPEWDIAVGTSEYKALESVAQELENLAFDSVLNDFHFDIDKKSGKELDDFVGLFGFQRMAAKRATGTVVFGRATPATQDYMIPAGTQVYVPATASVPNIFFQTTTTVVMVIGTSQIESPVEAIEPGTSGNATEASVSRISGNPQGVTSTTNLVAMVGGRDQESDEDLRSRWKRTVFRNISGTEDQFLAIAFNDEAVFRAEVVGPVLRFREQLQVIDEAVTSEVPDSKYTYPPGGEFFGYNLGQALEDLGARDVDYTMSLDAPPTVSIINTTKFPNDAIVYLEHEYNPVSSRNDPTNGVVDKVDIFIAGDAGVGVVEQIAMNTAAAWTWGTGGSNLLRANWLRDDGVTQPTNGNFFMPLFKTPVFTLPEAISVGGTTYTKDVDYWLVRDMTVLKGSTRALDGIEWRAAHHPTNGAQVEVEYSFNAAVERVDAQINLVRLVGMDTLVHRGTYVFLKFNLGVVLNDFASIDVVEIDVTNAIENWISAKDFRANVQIADLIEVVGGVSGVDNVRLLESTEQENEKQRITLSGVTDGTFKLTFYDKTTADITYSTNGTTLANAIKTALEDLSNVTPGDILVNAVDTDVFDVTFQGTDWGHRKVGLMDVIPNLNPNEATINITRSQRGAGYGINSVAENGKTYLNTYTGDFYLRSDELPIVEAVVTRALARNTF